MSHKDRRQSFVNALFIVCSLVSLVYWGILLTISPSTETAIIASPIIVYVLLAFYAGYVRGAIERNSLRERARGWVYLIVGCGSYSIMLFFTYLAPLKQTYYIADLELLLFILAFAGLYYFTRGFVSWIFRYLTKDGRTPTEARMSFAGAGLPMFLFSTNSLIPGFYLTLLTEVPLPLTSAASIIDVILAQLIWAVPLAIFEINCHHHMRQATDELERLRERTKGNKRANPNSFWYRLLWPLVRAGGYTVLVVFAGWSRHRTQYAMILLGLPFTLIGAITVLKDPILGLLLQVAAYLLAVIGLAWHARSDPGRLYTNRMIECIRRPFVKQL